METLFGELAVPELLDVEFEVIKDISHELYGGLMATVKLCGPVDDSYKRELHDYLANESPFMMHVCFEEQSV